MIRCWVLLKIIRNTLRVEIEILKYSSKLVTRNCNGFTTFYCELDNQSVFHVMGFCL
jgi:hypothetical protein